MNWRQRLLRAEYVWQPAQLPRRAWRALRGIPARASATIVLPWRFPIVIDPRETIGRSIVALNALDLPVTETIWRLLDPGETAVDVGANIGYMTSVMGARLHAGGRVVSFEPVPQLAEALRANVERWRSLSRAEFQVHACATGRLAGPAELHMPPTFARNRGEASLVSTFATANHASAGTTLAVEVVRLESVIPAAERVGLIKIDVEGFELEVLHGADALLKRRAVRDIVFEEHGGPDAAAVQFLRAAGFEIFRVTRTFNGPQLLAGRRPLHGEIDPPTYLATLEPDRARARFAPRGWQALRARTAPPRVP